MFFDTQFAINAFAKIVSGVPLTLFLAVAATCLGLVMGLFLALIKMYKVPVLYVLTAVYISFFRSVPVIVQLYAIYFGVPLVQKLLYSASQSAIVTSSIIPILCAVAAFSLGTAAYSSELIRAALNSVERGQLEAAHSVGMTTWQGIKRIVIPQALVYAVPNIGNNFLGLIKGTSIASTILIYEVLGIAKIEASESFRYMEAYFDAALVYWIISLGFEKLFYKLEKVLKAATGISS